MNTTKDNAEEVVSLLKGKKTYKEISAITGLAKGTISYHASKNNLERGVVRNWQLMQEFLDQEHTLFECGNRFNITTKGLQEARRRGRITFPVKSKEEFLAELLVQNSAYSQGNANSGFGKLRTRLVKSGLLLYKCYICGIVDWREQQLLLELDHVNGVNTDNRLENLRILCPSCHSQTETFCGKNVKGVRKRNNSEERNRSKPFEEKLVIAFRSFGKMSQREIAQNLDCSKSNVSLLLLRLGLSEWKPVRKYNWGEIQAFYNKRKSARKTMIEFGISKASWEKACIVGFIKIRTDYNMAMPVEKFFSNKTIRSGTQLRGRLIKENFAKNKCLWCKRNKWQGKKLTLQVDHINGDNQDNRILNIRLLCPNCHSQTNTYGSKNRGRPMKGFIE